jgi:type I restriction enzyme S subunit
MQISPYDNLKFSGSIWLGDIPTHWSTKKLKFLATVQPSNVDKKTVEGEEPVILCNYTDVYKNDYIDRRLGFMQASATKAEIEKFKVEIGDVIVTKDSETPDDIAVPACVSEEVEGLICGYHLTQIKPINLHGRYLFRLFQSKGFNAQFVVSANGVTRFGLPQHAIANAFTPIPPLDEQQAIARFLDFKTAQIDALIAKKKSLLDKLAEKRTALISHAVTKGLDSSVAMKDSKVSWLGEIPSHWVPKRMRFCMKTNPSKGEIKLNDDELVSFIPMEAVGEFGGLNLDAEKELGEIGGGYTYFADNDVVVAKITPCFENGKGAIAHGLQNGMAFGTTELHVMRSDDTLLPDYLFHLTMSHPFRCIGESEMYGAGGQKRVPETFLKDFRIGLPPVNEQQDIIDYINKVNQKLDLQMSKATDVIGRLTEYRSALITNAVTGKIDVRDFEITKSVIASNGSDE